MARSGDGRADHKDWRLHYPKLPYSPWAAKKIRSAFPVRGVGLHSAVKAKANTSSQAATVHA